MTAFDELLEGKAVIAALLAHDDIRRIRTIDTLPDGSHLETFLIGTTDDRVEAHIVGWRVGGRSFNLPDWADIPANLTRL